MGSPRIVPTGVQGLDGVIGGGFPEGTLCLVTGASWNPEHTFLRQFAGEGIERGERVIWIEADRPGANVEEGVRQFARSRRSDGIEVLHIGRPGGVSGGDGWLTAEASIEQVARSILEKPRPTRVVVESLSVLAMALGPERTTAALTALADACRHSGAVAAVHVVEGAHSPGVLALWRHLASAVLKFDVEKRGFGVYCFILVEKILGATDVLRILPLTETPFGLRLETARRV